MSVEAILTSRLMLVPSTQALLIGSGKLGFVADHPMIGDDVTNSHADGQADKTCRHEPECSVGTVLGLA
jgi:hypothetical protein